MSILNIELPISTVGDYLAKWQFTSKNQLKEHMNEKIVPQRSKKQRVKMRRLSMKKIKDILRLKFITNILYRQISRALNVT